MISKQTLGLILAGSSLLVSKKSKTSSVVLFTAGSVLFVHGIISARNLDLQAVRTIPIVAGTRG